MSRTKLAVFLILFILVLDQAIKIWIKTTMMLGQEFHVIGDWFIIHFTENEGMAFGWKLGGESGKMILSIFRIVAIVAIGWYIFGLIRQKAHKGLIFSMSLIFAGALGNLIDSAVYGLIFNESYGQIAELFPEGGGYAGFLHGKVVDMLYFPLIEGHYPSWFPIKASEEFIFFRPVFNIADSSITVGVFIILFFQGRFFAKEKEKKKQDEQASETLTENHSQMEIK